MIAYRLKSENIVYDLYLPEKSNGKTILYVPGLPGHPRRKILGESFANNGFTFFEMRFIGSWESDGIFTMNNCVKSLEEAYEFVKYGSGVELRKNTTKNWPCIEIIVLGSSFGGGVVLSSKIGDALTYVVLAPLTKLQNLRDSLVILPSGRDELYNLLSQGYTNVYRGLSEMDWQNFLNGNTLVNPENNFDNLKNKKVVFIQGTDDTVITHNDTNQYVEGLRSKGLNIELITIDNVGHGGELENKSIDKLIKIM